MNLGKIIDCKKQLDSVFELRLQYPTNEKLCDLLIDIEKHYEKYVRLYDKLLKDYCDVVGVNENGTSQYRVKPENAEIYEQELQALNETPIERDKYTIPPIKEATAKELMYLREFFNFSE